MVKKKIVFTENILTVTMATNLSIVIDKSKYKSMLIIMPATWTAADITFVVSSAVAGTFAKLTQAETDNAPEEVRLKDPVAGTVISFTGRMKDAIEASPFVKLRSGTAASPISQDSARTFIVVLMG